MTYEFRLPDIGEGVHEGEIVKWLVQEGDPVRENQDIVEVMTDKATVQLSAPRSGRILSIKFRKGEVVHVGDVVFTIEEGAPSAAAMPGTAAAGKMAAPSSAAGASPAAEEKTLFDLPTELGTSGGGQRPARPAAAPRASGLPHAPQRTAAGVLAPPSVRIEARRRGLDLSAVKGTARGGRITLADLEAARPAASASRPGAQSTPSGSLDAPPVSRDGAVATERLAPPAGSPRETAARANRFQPPYSYVLTVSADGLPKDPTATVLHALVSALADHPRCNALVDERTGELVVARAVNVAVAVASAQGLAVRTLADAGRRTVVELERALSSGASDRVTPTFTVTALGPLAGLVSTPILSHPQVAALAIGALRDVPVLRGNKFVPGRELTLSFTFDHRYVDGYDGALFAQEVARLVESARS